MKYRSMLFAAGLFFISAFVFAQAGGADGTYSTEKEEASGAELPRSFRGIVLGMGLEDLKTALQDDEAFRFRADRDVSLLPSSKDQTLVETQGVSFIKRAFFQLRSETLIIMSFSMDPSLVDHYSIFTAFVNRYGDPDYLDPREAVWESEDIRVSLERPLTVKYIDKQSLSDMVKESSADGAEEMVKRNQFLDGF
jgi:hypothetical protein